MDRFLTLPPSPAAEHARSNVKASPRMLDPGGHNTSTSVHAHNDCK